MEITNQNLKRYRQTGFDKVQGWCHPSVFYALDLLDSAPLNKVGGVCEIGVHHGKFYLLLNQLSTPDAHSYAIDVFEKQALNIDKSGAGSREVFKRNLCDYDLHQGRNTTIIAGDSTDVSLNLATIIKPGSIRFFSVDGGHTAEHTICDLETANELTSNEGVVIVDDFTNEQWLGVVEGVVGFLSRRPTLVPFAVGANKLYFSKLTYQRSYYDLFAKSPLRAKPTLFFGHQLVALGAPA